MKLLLGSILAALLRKNCVFTQNEFVYELITIIIEVHHVYDDDILDEEGVDADDTLEDPVELDQGSC